MKWFKKQRLNWIHNRFEPFNRKHLCDYFDISIPQASLDIKEYMKKNPYYFIYNRKARHYERVKISNDCSPIQYSLEELKANIRTYIPDFEMASQIMQRLK